MISECYFDHHASAPLSAASRARMIESLAAGCANPASPHRAGRRAREVIERARGELATALATTPRALVFTSGGTEANHLAVLGLGIGHGVRSVIVDPGAHPSLRAACELLALRLGVPLRTLRSVAGEVRYELEASEREALVALTWVQHETGRIASGASDFIGEARGRGMRVVVDAVQALGKVPAVLSSTGADAVTFSSHKLGGPQGVGAVWLDGGVRLDPQLRGGGQERGLRAGTPSPVLIAGFGAAAGEHDARLASQGRIARLRDRIERALCAIEGVVASSPEGPRVATVTHVAVRGCDGAELAAAFDVEGVALSSRAACSSGRSGPSESILRLFPDEPWRASSALRVSLGPETSGAEVDRLLALAPAVIERARAAYSKTKR